MILSLPPNIKISDWPAQNDILPHPKHKFFISHAALLSIRRHGGGLVGILFIVDQYRNLLALKSAEVAVKVDAYWLTTEKHKKAIEEVLGNPKYLRSIRTLVERIHHAQTIPSQPNSVSNCSARISWTFKC